MASVSSPRVTASALAFTSRSAIRWNRYWGFPKNSSMAPCIRSAGRRGMSFHNSWSHSLVFALSFGPNIATLAAQFFCAHACLASALSSARTVALSDICFP